MKIDIENPAQLLSHVLLQNSEVATKVAETDEWKNNETITCTVQFNGVECEASVLESVLKHFIECVEEEVDVEGFNDKVQEAAKQILQERAEGIMEKLEQIQRVVDYPEDYIKPYWEK